MGTDPENPDYEPGDECPLCVDLLFDGATPKYVEADVTDIVVCPPYPWTPPEGTFLLTQIHACVWQYPFDGSVVLEWHLLAGNSFFTIGFPGALWFFSASAINCVDAFVNSNVCGVGLAVGSGGYVTVWWGPTIGP